MRHKLHLFSWLLLTAALLMPAKTMAQVVIDNITYTFSGTEATITKISPLPANLVIPPTVTYNGVTYNVTTLDNFNTSDIVGRPTSITATSIKKIFTSDVYLHHSRLLYSRSLKTIFQHKACTVKLYADSFYKVQKNSHSSFEVICCCS